VEVPGLGRVDEVELKAAALLRLKQLLDWGGGQSQVCDARMQAKALDGDVPVPSSLASSRTTSAST